MVTEQDINRLRSSGAILLDSPDSEIRIDLKSQRLAEMMGFATERTISPEGRLNNFCVIQQRPYDLNVRPKPTVGVEYGRSPMTRR